MRKLFILCLGCLALSLSSVAQNVVTLSMYRDAVLADSYKIEVDVLNQMTIEEKQSIIKKGFLPTLNASGDFALNFRDEMTTIGGVSSRLQPYSFSLQPQIIQTIYGGHGVRNNYKRVQVELEMAENLTLHTVSEIIYAADYAYWNLASNRAYVDASMQYVKIIQELRDIIELRFKDGYISKRDLLMTDVRLGEAEYSLISAQQSYSISLSNFNILMGVDINTPYKIDANVITTATLPHRIKQENLFDYRSDYTAAQKRIEYEEYGIKVARSAYNPQVVGGISGAWRNNTPNINGGSRIDGYMFVRVSIPIFAWGERRNTVNIAQNMRYESTLQLDNLKDLITQEENIAWLSIEHSSMQVDKSVYSLQLGRDNLQLNTYSYNEGQIPISDVLSAQLSWLQLYTNAITAGYNYKVSIAQYRNAIGKL